MPSRTALALIIKALLIWPLGAAAREVAVPVRLDHDFLRQALLTQVYTGAEQTVRVWDDGSGCNFLILSEPARRRAPAAGCG